MSEHRRVGLFCLVMGLLCLVGVARAQSAANDVTFTVSAASVAPGQAVPTLTWSSTTPAPTSCQASGNLAWSGVKAANGTQVLPAIRANASYVLSCTFAASTDTSAVVTWSPPTTNTDGTPLTDLASYNVYWNVGDPSLVTAPGGKVKSVPPASTPTTTISGLTPGNWYFTVTVLNAAGVESAISNVASKTIGGGGTVSKTAAVVFPGTAVITVK